MRSINLIICFVFICSVSFAQGTIEKTQKLNKKITAVYHVLQTDPAVKEGLYQARHDKTMALASGLYKNNARVGLWHFFDYDGNLVQNYNYDKNILTYEAPDDLSNGFKYAFDKKIIATDTITKPIRIGGRYFGYLNYMLLYKEPKGDTWDPSVTYNKATVELLISPGGHLADYTIHLLYYGSVRDLHVNLDLLSEEDKIFIPATVNGEPVSSSIVIPCTIDMKGNMVFGS